jgi:hypothetical protein
VESYPDLDEAKILAKIILKKMVFLIIFLVVGCLFGYLLGSSSGPGSTQWTELSPPPETAVKIIELGGYGSEENSIVVESASGKQYSCCGSWPSAWEEVTYKKSRYGPECSQIESTLLDQLPAKPVDCAFISQFEWTTEQYYAALLPDGSLWRWHFVHGLSTIADAAGKGALTGLVLGIIWLAIQKWLLTNKSA